MSLLTFLVLAFASSTVNPKENKMKITLLILSAGVIVTSCSSKPKTTETLVQTTDTTVMAKPEIVDTVAAVVPATAVRTKTTTSARTAPHTTTSSSSSSTSSSESTNSAKAKKGWSKTAKGAVIGGVVGAGTGVIVNKKHRVTGGIVGGAVGAGAGAIIGNELDKKSGRH